MFHGRKHIRHGQTKYAKPQVEMPNRVAHPPSTCLVAFLLFTLMSSNASKSFLLELFVLNNFFLINDILFISQFEEIESQKS